MLLLVIIVVILLTLYWRSDSTEASWEGPFSAAREQRDSMPFALRLATTLTTTTPLSITCDNALSVCGCVYFPACTARIIQRIMSSASVLRGLQYLSWFVGVQRQHVVVNAAAVVQPRSSASFIVDHCFSHVQFIVLINIHVKPCRLGLDFNCYSLFLANVASKVEYKTEVNSFRKEISVRTAVFGSNFRHLGVYHFATGIKSISTKQTTTLHMQTQKNIHFVQCSFPDPKILLAQLLNTMSSQSSMFHAVPTDTRQ